MFSCWMKAFQMHLISKYVQDDAFRTQLSYYPWKNQGLPLPYSTLGKCIGSGATRSNIELRLRLTSCVVVPSRISAEVDVFCVWPTKDLLAGMTTPHSQFRQFNLICFVLLFFERFPQALSERLALPTYAQDLLRPPSVFMFVGVI